MTHIFFSKKHVYASEFLENTKKAIRVKCTIFVLMYQIDNRNQVNVSDRNRENIAQ